MAQSGMTPGDEQAEAVAEVAGQHSFTQGMGPFAPGQQVTPDMLKESQPKDESMLFRAAKGVVRTGLTALAAPFEEVSQGITAVGEAALDDDGFSLGEVQQNLDAQGGSQAYRALSDLNAGREVDLGSGFMPGGEINRRWQQDKLERNGTFLTPGRLAPEFVNKIVGRRVWEPGNRAYDLTSGLLDFSANLALDPTAIAGKGAKAFRGARAAFGTRGQATHAALHAVGLAPGTRPSTIAEQASRWLDTTDGNRVVDWIAGSDRVTDIMQIKGMPTDIAATLREMADTSEIKDVLRPMLGRTISHAPKPGGAFLGAGGFVERRVRQTRFLNDIPERTIDQADMEDVYEQMQKTYSLFKFDEPTIEKLNRQLVQVPTDAQNAGLFRFMANDVAPEMTKQFVKYNADEKIAARLVKLFGDEEDLNKAFWHNQITGDRRVPGSVLTEIDGVKIPQPTPHFIGEYVNRKLPLPDPTEVKRQIMNPGLKKLVGNRVVKGAVDAVDGVLSSVWKPMALLRGAYVLRVVGEEQLRMGAHGLDSAFRHPMSYIAWLAGRKGALDVKGNALDDASEYVDSLARSSTDWIRGRAGSMWTGEYHHVRQDSDQFIGGWLDELQLVAGDDIARAVLDAKGDLNSVVERMHGGDLDHLRRRLMTTPEKTKALSQRHLGDLTDAPVDSIEGYVKTTDEIIRELTGGDTELLDGLRSGALDGTTIRRKVWTGKERNKLRGKLESKITAAPEFVRAQRSVNIGNRLNKFAEMDTAVSRLADIVMVHPTNKLSRHPTFMQTYWREAENVLSFADEATANRMVANARKAKLDKTTISRMEDIAGTRVGVTGDDVIDDIDALDLLAKKRAVDETKKLLYDLTKRSNFSEATRLAMPFAEAWKEFVGTWTRELSQNPAMANRGYQAVSGARESNPWEIITGGDTAEGPGFFYPDDTTGQEMFVYPIPFIGKLLGGDQTATVGLAASAEGLNLAAQGPLGFLMPGIGPAVQIPMGHLLSDKPRWDWLEKIILPYGRQDTGTGSLAEGAVDSLLPPWAKKLYQAWQSDPKQDRIFGNVVGDILSAKYANGTIPQPSDMSELNSHYEDSTDTARWLYAIRGIAQVFAPSAPQFKFDIKDLKGNSWKLQSLGQLYSSMSQQQGDQAAVGMMVNMFGERSIPAALMRSSKEIQKRPLDEKGAGWWRENQDAFDRHPLAAGYFAPNDPGAPYDYQAYENTLAEGSRESLDPVQSFQLAMSFLGDTAYQNAREQALAAFGSLDTEEARGWLKVQKHMISQEMLGFGREVGSQREDPADVLEAIRAATSDPTLGSTANADAIREILAVHDGAMATAVEGGLSSYFGSARAKSLREWVAAEIDDIALNNPGVRDVQRLIESLMRQSDDELYGDMVRF
jgi:hypothetical protein